MSSSDQKTSAASLVLGAIALVLLAFSILLILQVRNFSRTRAQEDERFRIALAITMASDARRAEFPRTRIVFSRSHGIVLLLSDLPRLAPGKAFELWFTPRQQAGLIFTNTSRRSAIVVTAAVPADASAVTVTMEDEAGAAAPSGTPVLNAPLPR